jgi:hypothetical protein
MHKKLWCCSSTVSANMHEGSKLLQLKILQPKHVCIHNVSHSFHKDRCLLVSKARRSTYLHILDCSMPTCQPEMKELLNKTVGPIRDKVRKSLNIDSI